MNEMTRSPARWGMFGDQFDDLFEGFLRPTAQGGTLRGVQSPAVDVSEDDDRYVVRADIPGVKREDIDITVHDGVLTLTAKSSETSEEEKDGRVVRRERHWGSYTRSMRMGAEVDESKVKATYNDGVLEVVIPKVEKAKPRQIKVEGH